MTTEELRLALTGAGRHSLGTVKLYDGRVVQGVHPRIVTQQNMEAVKAGCDDDVLVMTVTDDPEHIYTVRIGAVADVAVTDRT